MAKKNFFEGNDFKETPFRALMPKYYPDEYKEYIEQEIKFLKDNLKGAKNILEAGIGIGRLIPELSPIVENLIGIDNADLMISESKKASKNFNNVSIKKTDIEKLSKEFPENYFDFSICVWNTLGNVEDESIVLNELKKVTKNKIFITTYLKGTIENRINWYKEVGIEIEKIDKENEIFYSKSGLKSKSFNYEDMQNKALESGLHISNSKILGGVMLLTELSKKL